MTLQQHHQKVICLEQLKIMVEQVVTLVDISLEDFCGIVVDRIDYSNDTATASPKGNLSVARGYVASTGNNDFGYTGGEYLWDQHWIVLIIPMMLLQHL